MARQLAANKVHVYVSQGGRDTNAGATPATAFATLSGAYQNLKQAWDHQGFDPVVHIGDGVYNDFVLAAGPLVGAIQLIFEGNAADHGAVKIMAPPSQFAFSARDLGVMTIKSATLASTLGGGGVSASQFGVVDYGDVVFDSCPGGTHVFSSTSGSVNQIGIYGVSAGAANHLFVAAFGLITLDSSTPVAIANTPAFDVFARNHGGLINIGGPITYNGGCTGQKHFLLAPGVVYINGTVFPGDAAGFIAPGAYIY